MAAYEKKPKPPPPFGSPEERPDAPAGTDSNVSRRAFLKTVGVTSIAGGLLAPATAEAQGARAVGPGEVAIQLTINGKRHDLKVEPRVTLLDAVRNRLDITGSKRVCDRGACGACTMIVDGRTIYACSTLAIEMQGKAIRTVEGFATGTVLHPVQQAFCESRRPDVRLLHARLRDGDGRVAREESEAHAAQARAALDGNICRCGTYVKVLEAALNAKGVQACLAGLPTPNASSSASRSSASTAPPKRRAAPSTPTTSSAPACSTAAIVRSPHPHAEIVGIDLSRPPRRRPA